MPGEHPCKRFPDGRKPKREKSQPFAGILSLKRATKVPGKTRTMILRGLDALKCGDAPDGQAGERCRAKYRLPDLSPPIFRPHGPSPCRTRTTAARQVLKTGTCRLVIAMADSRWQTGTVSGSSDVLNAAFPLIAHEKSPTIPGRACVRLGFFRAGYWTVGPAHRIRWSLSM